MTEKHLSDQQLASVWAAKILARPDVVVLDTETTGLGRDAEICQIAIIDLTGAELLNTLVKPRRPIPRDASAIHRITDAMVVNAPTFAQIAVELRGILSGMTCVIYNASYDTRLLEQSAAACGIAYEIPIFGADYTCAMEEYAAWYGEWSEWHGNYRFQKLPGGDHSALGDALACLNLLRTMAADAR